MTKQHKTTIVLLTNQALGINNTAASKMSRNCARRLARLNVVYPKRPDLVYPKRPDLVYPKHELIS